MRYKSICNLKADIVGNIENIVTSGYRLPFTGLSQMLAKT